MATGGDEGFEIFLSWSGVRAGAMAQALRDWLPVFLPGAQPWSSNRDIHAGTVWLSELLQNLKTAKYGIVCLTPENVDSRWMLFEAGAVSNALDEARICPYLLGLEPGEVANPLGLFQGKRTDKEHTFEMLQSLNEVAPTSEPEPVLRRRFDPLWPQFEEILAAIPEPDEAPAEPTRDQGKILQDLVEEVRGFGWQLLEVRARAAFGAAERRVVPERGGPPSPDWWAEVVRELKRRKQALTAAVYGEALAHYDGEVLWLTYPDDQNFYVGMAQAPKHTEVMLESFETVAGVRPSVVRVTSRSAS